MSTPVPPHFTDYLAPWSAAVVERLTALRTLVLACAPDAAESFSYGMPAFKTHGKPLVYFAAYPKHIGLYATPSGHSQFSEALKDYKQGKGSVQFPHDRPMPWELIESMVRFRVAENETRQKKKGPKK